jgi:hypothetical protein
MSVVIDHFETLRERFPTWEELESYLTSKEGGALRVVVSESVPTLRVIRYVKGVSDLRSPNLGAGLFRSVVWDTVSNRPVCFAPAKANESAPPLHTAFPSVEEFLDGVMLNVFVTAAEPTVLRLATRTQLGAQNTFYTEKTFEAMFVEGLAATPVRTREALLMHLREAMGTAHTAAFASFVIQHPDHPIVARIPHADVHMVHMGVVTETGGVQVWEQAAQWPAPLRRLQIPRYPVKVLHSEGELTDLMRRTAVQNGPRWQGLVFKDGTGTRWRTRSAAYMNLRALRGAEANTTDRFLRLRKEGKVKEYLNQFRDERNAFWNLETQLRAKTAQVLDAYIAVHKAHTMKFADLPAAYKPAVHLLHVLYLGELRAENQKVQLQNAIQIVNGLKAFEQRRLMDAEDFVTPVIPVASDAAT